MKPLREIRAFPKTQRETLERQFGIQSAEAFYEHAIRNAAGMQKALQLTPEALASLRVKVEGFLTPDFLKACAEPVKKHARGVIVR
jgi:hypothetical protein